MHAVHPLSRRVCPPRCSETWGRLRYLGLFSPRRGQSHRGGSHGERAGSYEAQLDLILDPDDPEVIEQARRDGIPQDWLRRPNGRPYALAKEVHGGAAAAIREYRPCPWSGTSRRCRRVDAP